MTVHEHRAGPASLTWDDDARLGTLRFVDEGIGTREHAEELVGALRSWTAEEGGTYRFLVDCGRIRDVDAGWRATWAEYFKTQTRDATIAWFNASSWIKLVILMFRKGTGVHGAVFTTEDEARAWITAQPGQLTA